MRSNCLTACLELPWLLILKFINQAVTCCHTSSTAQRMLHP
jgi:hypothetical protein